MLGRRPDLRSGSAFYDFRSGRIWPGLRPEASGRLRFRAARQLRAFQHWRVVLQEISYEIEEPVHAGAKFDTRLEVRQVSSAQRNRFAGLRVVPKAWSTVAQI